MKQVINIVGAVLILVFCLGVKTNAQNLNTATLRDTQTLDGIWNVHIAPFGDAGKANMSKTVAADHIDPVFMDRLKVPGDWNTQSEKLYYFEGAIFYKRNFNRKKEAGKRFFIHFGAVNYQANVYLNGKEVGMHTGGFTPFNFEITDVMNDGENTLVVRATNDRRKAAMPTVRYDWWNYGGLTRSVSIVETPATFISDFTIHLQQNSPKNIEGQVQLTGEKANQEVMIEIPELKVKKTLKTNGNGVATFNLKSKKIRYWSPNDPYRYKVMVTAANDKVEDHIGLRTIEAKGGQILLNGKQLFLCGINIHEEAPMGAGRVTTVAECRTLLQWAKDLGCNFVRLAHYPHSELMIREAEKMGLMVWSEIPVYWNIDFESKEAYKNAEQMLTEMITRDKNSASVILWSVANETRESDARQQFLTDLLKKVKSMDQTRLTTAAIEAFKEVDGVRVIDDKLGKYIDVIGVNCYCGWYFRQNGDCPNMGWDIRYEKPVIFSEFGAGALQGLHGKSTEQWTEEFQVKVYEDNIEMIKKQMPFLDGMTPWLLMDFRSPIRPNRLIQNDYNRKGLISEQGIRKKAFYTLQKFYKEVKNEN
ncbi:beta-glucuronidase [Prolixibacteraceae bacterium JC049]|nr:beta-glucuronidase [Prolixibacteraceae bacterium JC049]